MQTERSLAEGFIASHPAEAARVLESLPPAQLVVLFNEIPAPLTAACLANLASAKSAEILAETPADRAGRIFEALQAHEAASLLRPTTPEQREKLLENTPAKVAEPIRRLLRYPRGDRRQPDGPQSSVAAGRHQRRRSAIPPTRVLLACDLLRVHRGPQ